MHDINWTTEIGNLLFFFFVSRGLATILPVVLLHQYSIPIKTVSYFVVTPGSTYLLSLQCSYHTLCFDISVTSLYVSGSQPFVMHRPGCNMFLQWDELQNIIIITTLLCNKGSNSHENISRTIIDIESGLVVVVRGPLNCGISGDCTLTPPLPSPPPPKGPALNVDVNVL